MTYLTFKDMFHIDYHHIESNHRENFDDYYYVPLKKEMKYLLYLGLLLYLLQIQLPPSFMIGGVVVGNLLFSVPAFTGENLFYDRVGPDTMAYVYQGG